MIEVMGGVGDDRNDGDNTDKVNQADVGGDEMLHPISRTEEGEEMGR